MSVTQELIEQRDRIAGVGGFTWVSRCPINFNYSYSPETCAVMWKSRNHLFEALSEEAVQALEYQILVLTGDNITVPYFNDYLATHETILEVFDQAIKEVSSPSYEAQKAVYS